MSNTEYLLSELEPNIARLCNEMVHRLELEGIEIRVTQGLRTWAQQELLYNQGRTTPGKIVTNAKPGHSWHNFGLAFDVVPLNPQPDWNIEHPDWKRIIKIGESLGLVSGSRWRSFPDYPHFQLTGRFPVSPTDEVRQILKDGGIQAVWKEAQIA